MDGCLLRKSGFLLLMWAFLFVLGNFRIQGVDILPDFIGYILMAVGIHYIKGNDTPGLETAERLSILMILVSLFNIYQAPNPRHISGFHIDMPNVYGPLAWIVEFVATILLWMIVYRICCATEDIATELLDDRLPSDAKARRLYFNWFSGLTLLSMLLSVTPLAPIGAVLGMFLFIADIILLCLLMSLMWRVHQFH